MGEFILGSMSGPHEICITATLIWLMMYILGRLALTHDVFLMAILFGDMLAAIATITTMYSVGQSIFQGNGFDVWSIARWEWWAIFYMCGNFIYVHAIWKDATEKKGKPTKGLQ